MLNKEISRYVWVDCVKIFACILVVLGHLYMSLVSAGLIASDAVYYCLPIQAIYTFHVPLFFVCSGFLYQIKTSDYSLKEHVYTIKTKAIALGVPYFTFTIITLVLKNVFSSSVNNQATPFFQTLFLEPVAPYWYLYALFFIFCITPRFKSQKSIIVAFVISFSVKLIFILIPFDTSFLPYALRTVILNEVWFVFGMLITTIKIKKNLIEKIVMSVSFLSAVVLSAIYYRKNETSSIIKFIIGILFVISIIYAFVLFSDKIEHSDAFIKIGKYFMPVFLMHTICAAAMRSLLFKLGVSSLVIHITVGIAASFLLPVFIYTIAQKIWILQFWFEPLRALKRKEKKNV